MNFEHKETKADNAMPQMCAEAGEILKRFDTVMPEGVKQGSVMMAGMSLVLGQAEVAEDPAGGLRFAEALWMLGAARLREKLCLPARA